MLLLQSPHVIGVGVLEIDMGTAGSKLYAVRLLDTLKLHHLFVIKYSFVCLEQKTTMNQGGVKWIPFPGFEMKKVT